MWSEGVWAGAVQRQSRTAELAGDQAGASVDQLPVHKLSWPGENLSSLKGETEMRQKDHVGAISPSTLLSDNAELRQFDVGGWAKRFIFYVNEGGLEEFKALSLRLQKL